MEYSVLIAAILLATGGVSVAFSLYVVQTNYRPAIGKVFTAIGLSVFCWSFGLAIAAAALEREVSLIGSRIASLGCLTSFALFLNATIILTNHHHILKKWWVYPAIYLPALVSVYWLVVAPMTGYYEDVMVRTRFGWAYENAHPLEWLGFAHCAAYSVAVFTFIGRWAMRTDSANERKYAWQLAASLCVSLAAAAAVEVAFSRTHISFPGMTNLYALLPLAFMGYAVKRLRVVQGKAVDPNERILDKAMLLRVYRIVAVYFFVGSLTNLFYWAMSGRQVTGAAMIMFSTLLALTGAGVLLLGVLKLEEAFKELVLSLVFSMAIPMITLSYIAYAGITVWASFFLWLIISLLFNKRLLLGTVILSAVQTQVLTWSVVPEGQHVLAGMDYVLRLGIVVMAAFLCGFANRVYRHRLKENEKYAIRQALVSDISHGLISVDENSFDEKANRVLEQCAAFLGCEQGSLALVDQTTGAMRYCTEWVSETAGTDVQRACSMRVVDFFPEIKDRLFAHRLLTVTDPGLLPDWSSQMRAYFDEMGFRGLVMLPITKNGDPIGFMIFGTTRPNAAWDREDVLLLPVIANIVADAVSKLADMRKIEWIAYHDQLTKLPNRMLLKKRLAQAIEDAQRTRSMVGVAFLDLDAFKYVNDTMGHETGDQLLVKVSAAISSVIKGHGSVARFGGDEFVLLFERFLRVEELTNVIERVMSAIEKPVVLQNQEFFVTGSAGIALYPQDGATAETLINNADIAMFDAKALGKRRYVFCSEALKNRVLDNTRLANLLHRALEREELEIYYQPQVSLEAHRIVGLEALLRWRLPDRGFVSPAVFIPLAEQTGLIHTIGAWVLETACRQSVKWREMGFAPMRIAVNVSVQQLRSRTFVQQVAGVLAGSGLEPGLLELEITESVANSGARGMVEILTHLKALGVSISIDDFGTEYSSLGRLKLLPIDRIKLDMQFVQGIEQNPKDRAIAQVIINLAKNLHLKVIAEGVETGAQLSFLKEKLCDEVQGYYFFRPMPADEIDKALRQRRECPEDAEEAGVPAKGRQAEAL